MNSSSSLAKSGPRDVVNWEESKEDELKKSELDDSFVDLQDEFEMVQNKENV